MLKLNSGIIDIFDNYTSMTWLHLADGIINKIVLCKFSDDQFETTIAYREKDDHILMNMACMLHIVYLYRLKNLSAVDKVLAFFILEL